MSGASAMMGGGYAALAASASPASVSGSNTSSIVTSNSTTANVTGGSGSRTHAWSRVSGSASISATAPSSATTAFQATGMAVGSLSATFKCTVTDTVTGQVLDTNTVSVYLERSNPPLSASMSGSGTRTQTSPGMITVTSSGVTLSGSGGVPPYTFRHAYYSGSTDFSFSNSGGATTTHSKALGPGGGVAGTVRGTVTDSIGQTAYVDYGVVLSNDGTAPPPFTASASPTYVTGISAGSAITTGSTTAGGSGGTPTSFAWTRVSGYGAATNPGAATTAFSYNAESYDTFIGTFQCLVTDSLGRTSTITVTAEFTRYNPANP